MAGTICELSVSCLDKARFVANLPVGFQRALRHGLANNFLTHLIATSCEPYNGSEAPAINPSFWLRG